MRTSLAGRAMGRLSGLVMAGILLLVPALLAAQITEDDLLPADEAFAISATVDNGQVQVHWDIADGYYMYRHQFRFDTPTEGASLGEAELPPGEPTVDEFFGETETYRDRISIPVPVESVPDDGELVIETRSQGCADLGVCYPPHRQEVRVTVSQPTGAELDLPGEDPASSGPVEPAADSAPDAGRGSLSQALRGMGQGASGDGPLTVDETPLPPEEAFIFEALAMDPGTILVRFRAHEGYYLYKEQFEFGIDDADIRVVNVSLPEAVDMEDEFFGQTRVYFGEVEIPLSLSRPAGEAQTVELRADFQGCKKDGICYPPMNRTLDVELPPADEAVRPDAEEAAPAGTAATPDVPVSEQDRLAQALTGTPLLAMALFFIAGILLAFTPCVFPMIPILSGLIAGEGDRITTARAFRLSVVYVLAMALVYTAFGVIAGMFGQNLQALFQHPAVLIGFAGLFVVLSLAMFGFYELQLPASWQTRLSQISNRQESGTLMGAAIMGALSALIVGPCVAPALMGALIYIGQTGDAVLGGGALFAMAMGMGVPLVIWGTSAGKMLPRAGGWMNAIKAVFGVGLLALAIWMLERILPPPAVMLAWGGLAIACGVYLGALTRLEPGASGWQKLWQALGVMLLVLGIIQFIGAASGGRDWTRPLSGLAGGAGTSAPEVAFQPVQTTAELDAALAAAPGPVFVDFYADWCVDCRRMERRTFPDPEVASRLEGFTSLKIDVTDYNSDHQALLERFGLIGPPAYLFFVDEKELEARRLIGFLGPQPFANHLDQVLTES